MQRSRGRKINIVVNKAKYVLMKTKNKDVIVTKKSSDIKIPLKRARRSSIKGTVKLYFSFVLQHIFPFHNITFLQFPSFP